MIPTSYLTTEKEKRKERKAWIITIIEGLIVTALFVTVLVTMMDIGLAEPITEQVWVLCDPDSYVTLRSGPGKSKADFGGVQCGAELWTDGKTKNGYLHVMEIPAEESEGWIVCRNIVYDRPHEVNAEMEIEAEGRVACRKWIDGKVKGWAYSGDVVTVYWMSASWAVTNRGYIRSKFLSEVAQG